MRLDGGEAHYPIICGFEARATMEPCALAPSDNMNRPTVYFVVSNRYSRLDIFGFASSLWNNGSRG
jgi:hypothetical protein